MEHREGRDEGETKNEEKSRKSGLEKWEERTDGDWVEWFLSEMSCTAQGHTATSNQSAACLVKSKLAFKIQT